MLFSPVWLRASPGGVVLRLGCRLRPGEDSPARAARLGTAVSHPWVRLSSASALLHCVQAGAMQTFLSGGDGHVALWVPSIIPSVPLPSLRGWL